MDVISVTKEPKWFIFIGIVLGFVGLFGFVPFKVDGWVFASRALHVSLLAGLFMLVRAFQKIGWRLSLEGNVLYYQKFNLFSSWKTRRSSEFSLALDKIKTIKVENHTLRITYEPGRELKFNTRGLNSFSQQKLLDLIAASKR